MSQVSVEIAAMSAAAFLMVRSGLYSRLLERTKFRNCPACGRPRSRGVCDFCSRSA
jgi:hypothetical protein